MNFFSTSSDRRLERVTDEIKRSPENSVMREFDYLRGKLQEFLVEEREDVNPRSIEQSPPQSKERRELRQRPQQALQWPLLPRLL